MISTVETFFVIDPTNFEIIRDMGSVEGRVGQVCSDLLAKAVERYQNLMFVEDCSLVSDNAYQTLFEEKKSFEKDVNYKGKLSNLTISVINYCDDTELDPNMNEKYSIKIADNTAEIVSETVWGAIRGIETFSQLIENVGLNQFLVNSTQIEDWPRFRYRSLLLDTSRHFIPVKRLEQSLDAMAYNKMNVFHWHIVDDQSIPYVSEAFPDFSLKGAYNPKTHIYTADDIKHVIDYAKERGIRVLVEFDTPGHTLAWGKGQPGLLTPCYSGTKPNGHFGPIDPSKPGSYDFMKKLLTEVVDRFPDPYLHLGGDEVDYNCWRSNPNVLSFMRSLKLLTNSSVKSNKPFAKLEEYYILKVIEIAKELNKRPVVWQEVFDNGADLDADTIVHVWKLNNWESELFNVTKRGYQSILSSCWYINKISYATDWHKYYNCDPHGFKGSVEQKELVIGGEATMWGMPSDNLLIILACIYSYFILKDNL